MTKNLDSNGLRSIADNYDLFFVDLWGVIHNGIKLHKNAIDTLVEISRAKKKLRASYKCTTTKQYCKNIFKKNGHGEKHS